jgi:hypothetical protein
MERIFGSDVCSAVNSIDGHIEKHDLSLTRDEYLSIAEATRGGEGMHEVERDGQIYTVVVRGELVHEGKPYGIVRSIRRGGIKWKTVEYIYLPMPKPYQLEDDVKPVVVRERVPVTGGLEARFLENS